MVKKVASIGKKSRSAPPKNIDIHLGASGTQFFKGFYNIQDSLEYVNELQGQKAIETYNRMRKNDSQVKMALLALVNPIVNANWYLQEPGDPEKDDFPTDKEIEATKYINSWWFDESFRWELTLRQILSLFWAGFSVFEKLYVYDGKYIRLKSLAPRRQDTIVEWDIEEEELKQVRQYIPAGETAGQFWIPAEKLCVFTYDQEGNDFRGQSVLRAAYKHWYYKDNYYRIQGIQIERWSSGIPKIQETEDATTSEAAKKAAIEAVRNLRSHEEGYIYVPKGFEIELLDSSAGKMIDSQPAIDHHNASILKAIMAQFLELGQTETGARSLGETLKDMYLMGLGFTANYVCEVLRQNVLKELTEWNFGPDVRAPKLKCDGIQTKDFETLSMAYSNLFSSGAITKDRKIEGHLRTVLNLPPMEDEGEAEDLPNEDNDGKDEGKSDPIAPIDSDKEGKEVPEKTPFEKNKELVGRKGLENADLEYAKTSDNIEEMTVIDFYRPLRDSELNVSLREIVGRLDDTKERFVRATSDVREAAIDSLIAQVTEAYQNKEPLKIQEIEIPEELKQTLIDKVEPLIDDLMEYGRNKVTEELKRAKRGKPLQNAFPTADSESEEKRLKRQFITAMIAQFSEKALRPLADEARNQARTALRTGSLAFEALRESLEGFSKNTIRKSSRYVTQEAFNFGRDEQAKDMGANSAEYSAILDGGTCGPCAEMDGKTFEVGSGEYEQFTPPLFNCEGGSQCRCIWVYTPEG